MDNFRSSPRCCGRGGKTSWPEKESRPGGGQGHGAQLVDSEEFERKRLALQAESSALVPGCPAFVG